MSCKQVIPGTFIACGEGGNYCSDQCEQYAKLKPLLNYLFPPDKVAEAFHDPRKIGVLEDIMIERAAELIRQRERPAEPILFGCSCSPVAYGFKLYHISELACTNCGTVYKYENGKLTSHGRIYLRNGSYIIEEESKSHALNVERPA